MNRRFTCSEVFNSYEWYGERCNRNAALKLLIDLKSLSWSTPAPFQNRQISLRKLLGVCKTSNRTFMFCNERSDALFEEHIARAHHHHRYDENNVEAEGLIIMGNVRRLLTSSLNAMRTFENYVLFQYSGDNSAN